MKLSLQKKLLRVLVVLLIMIALFFIWIVSKKQSGTLPFVPEPLSKEAKQEILQSLSPSSDEESMSNEQKSQILKNLSVPK